MVFLYNIEYPFIQVKSLNEKKTVFSRDKNRAVETIGSFRKFSVLYYIIYPGYNARTRVKLN